MGFHQRASGLRQAPKPRAWRISGGVYRSVSSFSCPTAKGMRTPLQVHRSARKALEPKLSLCGPMAPTPGTRTVLTRRSRTSGERCTGFTRRPAPDSGIDVPAAIELRTTCRDYLGTAALAQTWPCGGALPPRPDKPGCGAAFDPVAPRSNPKPIPDIPVAAYPEGCHREACSAIRIC